LAPAPELKALLPPVWFPLAAELRASLAEQPPEPLPAARLAALVSALGLV
jgi:hypothetical protein